VGEAPVLITVEQRSVDVVVEVRGPAEGPFTVEAGSYRWGTETLLLESTGMHRIEVRPRERSIWPGQYTVQVSELPPGEEETRRALAVMSRAGRQAFEDTADAQRQAVATYREVLAPLRSLGERRREAEVRTALAALEHKVGELRPAVESYQAALALWQELGEPRREAAAWSELGVASTSAGDSGKAREALQRSLSLWQKLGERFEEGATRANLCFLDLSGGSLPAALTCYEETRALFRELGDESQEYWILNNVGGIYDLLGEPDAALEMYERSLALRREAGDRLGEAETLNNIAVIHRTVGDWQEALRIYGQAREVLAGLGDPPQKTATLLNNIGFTYNSLGEPQRALAFLEDVLVLRREIGDRRGETISLNNLGHTWRNLGDLEKALAYHRQALKLAADLRNPRHEAVARLGLAEIWLERGDPAAALRELDPAVAHLAEAGLRSGELQALYLRGRALTLGGRPREAVSILREVLEQRRTLRDRAGEAQALHALASAERSLGLSAEARGHAEEAVARVEELRTGFVNPNLRAAFLATRRQAYTLVIDLHMDRHAADKAGGYDRAALEVSERARARSLIDALGSGSAGRSGSPVPAGLIEKRQSLRRRLSAKAEQHLKEREKPRDAKAEARVEALGREIEKLLAELGSVETEIRRNDPQGDVRPMDAQAIAGLLDPGTLLLEYSLGEDRSFLWAVETGGIRSFELPPRKEIEALARQLQEELSTVGSEAGLQQEVAEKLSRILLGPIWSETPRFQRLAVVPDSVLHILPFSALPVPEPGQAWSAQGTRLPLLERHEVVYLPSATTLALQRQRLNGRAPASNWAAVLADPVFSPDDPRLAGPSVAAKAGAPKADTTRSGGNGLFPTFARLSSSRSEADAIVSLAPAGQVWTGLGLAANRDVVLSGDLRPYRVVHFATHGVADARTPELSGLVLSLVDKDGRPRQGFLGLSDIYDLDLAADLVVLSGCQTALGREIRGEGLMGLTRGFLHAGVPRVVASLWQVQDRTTAELMVRFYRAMWTEGLPPAAALRKAQRSLRKESRYRDPYSWSGFVLQGDWR